MADRDQGEDPGRGRSGSAEAIDLERVETVASLARLTLEGDEARAMARDLARILGYVETLDELDTADVEPSFQVIPLATPLRPDEPGPAMDPERVVANAPAHLDHAFSVPKVLAVDEEG